MTAAILDGKAASAAIKAELTERVAALKAKGIVPGIATVLVGADPSEIPADDELEEPSTEKDPSEEPKAPTRNDPEPDHEAVGIGVIDGPETDEGD